MKITWTVVQTAEFDLDEAIKEFNASMEEDSMWDYEELAYTAAEDNLWSDDDTAIELAKDILLKTLGGVQMKMDLPLDYND